MNIKKGDTVQIRTGKDGGKTGKVLRVFPKDGTVVVEGQNLYKKHSRPKRQGEKGETVTVAKPISLSNVGLLCPHCRRAVRVGFHIVPPGMKTRVCATCKTVL